MSAVVHNLKPEAATAKIELRDVCLSYFTPEGETEALSQVSFALAPGEFVSLIGQSGCGKSTLLSLIAGLITPTSGAVMIDGQAVTEPNPRIGYMLQQDYLFEWRTILDNVMLGAEIQGRRDARSEARAVHLLEKCGLGAFLTHTPRQLSGGMRQRAALARTLVTEPDVILLDEPFSALDFEMTLFIREKLQEVFMQTGTTMLLVSHDLEEAVYLADQVLLLTKRPTRVAEILNYGDARPRTVETLSEPSFIGMKKLSLEIFQREVRR